MKARRMAYTLCWCSIYDECICRTRRRLCAVSAEKDPLGRCGARADLELCRSHARSLLCCGPRDFAAQAWALSELVWAPLGVLPVLALLAPAADGKQGSRRRLATLSVALVSWLYCPRLVAAG